MAEVGLRIRVEKALRHEFAEACRAQDQTASQVLRAFMREYVDKHYLARQNELPLRADNDETSRARSRE